MSVCLQRWFENYLIDVYRLPNSPQTYQLVYVDTLRLQHSSMVWGGGVVRPQAELWRNGSEADGICLALILIFLTIIENLYTVLQFLYYNEVWEEVVSKPNNKNKLNLFIYLIVNLAR